MSEETEPTTAHLPGGIGCGFPEDGPLPPLRTYGRCRGCTHWGEPDLWPDVAECTRVPHDERENAFEMASVVDYEGYSAVLWTRGGFGCSLWEAT